MLQLNPYLSFAGNCREAMVFYQNSLGGELDLQTVGDSPMAEKMPAMKDKIMHSTLKRDGTTWLMASDMMEEEKTETGNMMALTINCTSEEEINTLFSKLSAGGNITHPLKKEFWGGLYGDFTDKFGIRWLLNYQPLKE